MTGTTGERAGQIFYEHLMGGKLGRPKLRARFGRVNARLSLGHRQWTPAEKWAREELPNIKQISASIIDNEYCVS